MKKLLYGAALVISVVNSRVANAQQLAGTSWQGTAQIPRPTEVIFQFKQDTLLLRYANTKVVLETLLYTQEGNQYTCTKVSGVSPCDNTTKGIYKFTITKDHMLLVPVLDRCIGRLHATPAAPLTRISWPAK